MSKRRKEEYDAEEETRPGETGRKKRDGTKMEETEGRQKKQNDSFCIFYRDIAKSGIKYIINIFELHVETYWVYKQINS